MTDKRIILLDNESNIGISRSMNSVINLIDSGIMLIAHSDDYYFKNRIEETFLFFDSHRNVSVLGSYNKRGRAIERVPHKNSSIRASMFFKNPIFNPSAAIHLDRINRDLLIYQENEPAEDYLFWINLSSDSSTVFANIPLPLFTYSKEKNKKFQNSSANNSFEYNNVILTAISKLFKLNKLSYDDSDIKNFISFTTGSNVQRIDFKKSVEIIRIVKHSLYNDLPNDKLIINLTITKYKAKSIIKYILLSRKILMIPKLVFYSITYIIIIFFQKAFRYEI